MSACLRRLALIGICSLIAIPYASATPGLESALTKSLQDVSPGLMKDESLARAARRHAREIARDSRRAARSAMREAVAKEGLADALLVPFATIGSTTAAFKAAIELAERSVRGRGMTHVGVAIERSVSVVLFSRRLVELAPLPRRVKNKTHRVRGRLASNVREPSAFLTLPSGEVLALPVKLSRDALAIDVPLDRGNGRYTIEILARTELGPEVFALWSFFKGLPPSPVSAPKAKIADERALASQIDQLRKNYGLDPLERDEALDRAARAHVQQVCDRLIAAHILPGGTTPEARAQKEGFGAPVAENVAIAESLGEASFNLMESPSHRINRLHPRANKLGLGTANNGAICLVELYGLQ